MNHGVTAPETHTTDRDSHTGWSGRLEAIDVFLTLFAKAMRQVHAYPVTSQVCVDAINACRTHLISIDGVDEIRLTVTPDALQVHEHPVGEGQFVRHELVRRLRRARVATLTVQRDSTARDLTRTCVSILRCSESTDRTLSVADLLAEDGVEAVTVEVTSRREVLQVAPSAPAQRDLIAHERRRREETQPGTRIVNLFPPHRGWIRLDPAESYDAVSLADLAILVDDPNDLAGMLDRLAEDTQAGTSADPLALERRFSNVCALFAGLEPRLSRMMFTKLGRVIVTMESSRKQDLLKRTVLPAIFDGRPEGQVLHSLSDTDLADALCLLFDPENGFALAFSALDQLKLAPERKAAVLPLMEELLRARIDPALGLDAATAIALDQQARRLTSVSGIDRRSFVELAGFDLRVDEQARATIVTVTAGIRDTDGTMAELICLVNLIGLQPNPEVAASFVQGVVERANLLVATNRWTDLADALERLANIVGPLREKRPEIVALVDTELTAFATPEFANALIAEHGQGDASQSVALKLIDALGPAITPSLLSLLETDSRAASVAVGLMCERASLFAQELADGIPAYPPQVRAHVARVLGHAGPGFEDALGGLCTAKDEKTTREALRGLSRIGTAGAAAQVGLLARGARDWMSTAIVETLLRFPPEIGAPAICDLLAERSFVLAQPAAAARLIGRLPHARVQNLEPVLRDIWSLRYRFWNRALVAAARDAGALLNR